MSATVFYKTVCKQKCIEDLRHLESQHLLCMYFFVHCGNQILLINTNTVKNCYQISQVYSTIQGTLYHFWRPKYQTIEGLARRFSFEINLDQLAVK